ncbi:MAG: zinc ABC transporter substrate-binding protein, partial [Firmicutes bacterium]|nr:zinc ABC transporter substrate-binding protein [Bacillota bacterium]
VVKLIDVLGGAVKEEELVEGMEDDHHHHDNDDHDEDHKDEHHDEDHDHEEEHELDEHVWLSLRNASAVCAVLCEKLSAIDPDGASEYEKNAAAYIAKLSELDGEYEAAVKAAARDTILFADRFPFRYLAEDYDLDYYAAFSGCSAETEASFETVIFLAGKVDELGLPAVLTIESCDGKIPQTVIDNTKNKDAKILMMDSMQSVTARDVKDGADYLAIMKENLKALREALE